MLKVGKFYKNPNLGEFYYYCNAVRGRNIELILIESFQQGQLIQATIELEATGDENSEDDSPYVEVIDPSTRTRLQRRLKAFRSDRN